LPRGKQGNADKKWLKIDRQGGVVGYEHSFLMHGIRQLQHRQNSAQHPSINRKSKLGSLKQHISPDLNYSVSLFL